MQLLDKINIVLAYLAQHKAEKGISVSEILRNHDISTNDKECVAIQKMLLLSDCIEPMDISGILESYYINITNNGLLTHRGGGFGVYQ